ncbi:MoaD/ThiS family protein [Desulfococcus sp.]|uniref:MoaD/ThiS family protein n=1 Tax=Desulfococcus sp. TaxID=2025834 RepID=UPI003593E79A
MKINVKCFSTLVNPETCDFSGGTSLELTEGQTVADAARTLGVDPGDVKLVFVNHRHAGMETRLADGDTLGLAPAVGGM